MRTKSPNLLILQDGHQVIAAIVADWCTDKSKKPMLPALRREND